MEEATSTNQRLCLKVIYLHLIKQGNLMYELIICETFELGDRV